MADFICPKCNHKDFFSLAQSEYKGPYRCTQCKTLFSVLIENDEFKSSIPLGQQEVERLGPLHNPYINRPAK